MLKARKAKRGGGTIVTYMRLKSEAHAQIVQIAKERGWPHSIASVTAEMISRGLKTLPKASRSEEQS
jgi:hypothetical protein